MRNRFNYTIEFTDDKVKERYSANHNLIYGVISHMAQNHVKDYSSLKKAYTLILTTNYDGSVSATMYYLKGQLCERSWCYLINKGQTEFLTTVQE